MYGYQTVYPRITNYSSPQINVQSSPTPSDSLKNLNRIKNLLLVSGFIANTLMALKEETYTTDPSTTRVIISPEDIFREVIFRPLHLQVRHK